MVQAEPNTDLAGFSRTAATIRARGSNAPCVLDRRWSAGSGDAELLGLTPATLRFGRRLSQRGFRVYLPLLFGDPGQDDWRSNYRALCISREFANPQAGQSGPMSTGCGRSHAT